jgi:hypothetical protein
MKTRNQSYSTRILIPPCANGSYLPLMRYRLLLLFSAFFFTVQILSAQYYNTGQDPASLKWKQIKTARFTIIYPENYGKGGITYAKSLDEAYSKLMSLFPEKKFNIPVIIHNHSIQSNGYVAWAPRRMELYPTPEQNTIPLSAYQQLATHELAHVLQMESLNQSFSKVMSFLFGEQFVGIISSLLPSWFLEGDAVFAESVLTQSGRGRTPTFQKQLKALVIENNYSYKYDKILNGSFRDFVPDDYETGFQMVTWALTKQDPQVWNKVLKFTAEEPFTINPFNISLTRSSGLRKKTLWEETCDSLKTIWTKDISKNTPSDYEVSNPDKHGKYINYYSPVYAGVDSILAVKTSFTKPASFVLVNPAGKKEKRILIPGGVYPWFISYAKGKLVWVETQPDARWINREYSVIKQMDIKSHEIKLLSRRTRYLAASLSPDGKTVAALENTINNINSLIMIDAATGNIIKSVSAPGNIYLQHPQWSDDGKKITLIFLSESGEGIISFGVDTDEWKILVDAARNDLQSSFFKHDSLYYISSSSGTDNVYILTPDHRTFPVTNSRYGTIDVTPAGNRVLFSNYTSLGNNICSIATDLKLPAPKKETSSFLINRFDIKAPSEPDTSSSLYTPRPYRKWQHLFRFHSWMPFYADIETIKSDPVSIRPGVTIMTQNSLSTLTSTIGYEYSADRRNLIHSRVTWSGWYPVIQSSLDYGALSEIRKMGEDVTNPSRINSGISFVNTISVPLQFSASRFSQFLQPSLSADYMNDYIYIKDKSTYDYGQTIFTGRLYFSNYDRSAIRDIYPRWAQIIDFNYCFAPFDKEIYGSILSLKTAFYFPGIFANNGLKIRLEREKQNLGEYLYGHFSTLPRGYNNIVSTNLQFFSADYVFPIVYPDFNIASLLYLKRIRGGLFYDFATGPGNEQFRPTGGSLVPLYNKTNQRDLESYGVQMLADFHLFRIPFMISGGFQAAWKNINEYPAVEVLFNIDLYGMNLGKKKM